MYNILICDDEQDIVNALKIYLANPDYHLLEAHRSGGSGCPGAEGHPSGAAGHHDAGDGRDYRFGKAPAGE